MEIKCRLVGVTPLMIYRFIYGYTPDKIIEGDDIRKECGKRLHTAGPGSEFEEGTVVIPQEAIFQSFMNGGRFEKLGKVQVSTTTSSILPGYVSMPSVEYKLEYTCWEADVRPVANAKGQRMLCYRPRFDKWAFDIVIQLHEPGEFGAGLMRKVIDHAGTKIGLLSYRPQKKGSYGIFRVDSWETDA